MFATLRAGAATLIAFAMLSAAVAGDDGDAVTFFDSVAFDSALSEQLSGNPERALVLPSASFSPNQIPPRLEKWLGAVSRSGGKVRLQKDSPVPPTRGILSDIVDMTVKANDDAEQAALYSPARNYEAIVCYSDNIVTSVRFVKRAAVKP